MSPDSRDLASYENYIRRELPRLVRSHIEEAVRREMQPLEASLISSLVEIIQDCQDRVFRSYRETQSRSRELQIPPIADDEALVSSTLLDNRDESNLRLVDQGFNPQSNFFNAIFETPSRSSESIAPALAGNDYRGNLVIQSGDMFLSDSGYSSEQLQLCGCAGHCNCGISQRRDLEDNPTQEIGDDNLRWDDWSHHF